MRTTIVIDDGLLREAKQAAARSGRTLSELISQALSAALAERSRPKRPFEMIVYGGTGRSQHEPHEFADALEADDAQTIGH